MAKVSTKTIPKIAKSTQFQADVNSAVEVFRHLSIGLTPEESWSSPVFTRTWLVNVLKL